MRRRPRVIGAVSVGAYLVALAAIEITGVPDWRSLAESPHAIAHGRLWLLLTSGLVVEGLSWAQILVLGLVLGVAVVRLGPAPMWTAALVAHVGAALVAYAAIGVLRLIDAGLVDSVVRAPDYGISVVLAGTLGALAVRGGRHTALLVGAVGLGGFGIGIADASVLANAEHLLGFALGALTIAGLDRRRRGRAAPG